MQNPDIEIGQRNHLSYYDIRKLLITYPCSNTKELNKNSDKKNKLEKKLEKKLDKKNDKNVLPKKSKEINKQESRENMTYKIENKLEAIITMSKPMSNKIDSKPIDFHLEKPDGNYQTFKISKHVQPNYYIPWMYPHIHLHIYYK